MAEGGIVSKILSAAREKGEQILREAEAKRDEEVTRGLAALSAEMEARRKADGKKENEAVGQELSAFRLVERNKTHLLKRRLLEEVYEEAWNKVLEPAVYRKWLEARLDAYCRPGDTLVVAHSQSRLFTGEFADLLKRRSLSLSEERGKFRAGFIVERGSLRYNCTLDEEIKEAARASEIEISQRLYGKAE